MEDLKQWYTTVVATDHDMVQDKYYEQRMKLTEQPSMYVMTMALLQNEVHVLGDEIMDVILIEPVLLKTLPTKDGGMCPYCAKKLMSQQTMSPEATQAERDSIMMEEVTTILKRVYQEKNFGTTAITNDGEKGSYTGGSNKASARDVESKDITSSQTVPESKEARETAAKADSVVLRE
jgi:hypothetical protein